MISALCCVLFGCDRRRAFCEKYRRQGLAR